MSEPTEIRVMRVGEEEEVCRLVETVFDEFVAPDFEEEGIAEFYRYANARALAARRAPDHFVLVAVRGAEIVGMIEVSELQNIALLFVTLRGQGIATELVRQSVNLCRKMRPEVSAIHVHASLFAVPVYEKLGFEATGDALTENGIRYVPMTLRLESGA